MTSPRWEIITAGEVRVREHDDGATSIYLTGWTFAGPEHRLKGVDRSLRETAVCGHSVAEHEADHPHPDIGRHDQIPHIHLSAAELLELGGVDGIVIHGWRLADLRRR